MTDPRMTRSRGRPPHDDMLTPGEWRVVEGVRHGLSNRKIAARLGVSGDAVKFHIANTLGKLGLASRVALRGWHGVQRGSAMGDKGERAMTVTGLGALGQIARSVADIEAARRFYGDTLGLPQLYSFGDLAFFDLGGVRLMLSQGDGGPAESILYFRVADIHAECERLRAGGVEVTHAPHMIHRHVDGSEEWMAFFADNERRPLGLMTLVAAD